ncbi:hypothetical protein Pme01_20140 [Planosporangium mesophilum]|uniref:Uncharacterized protein n=1 Tax=Planosporangium mesophilum TaxID=689768 RepID=A0A8J3WZN9_9ACTN|nr:hypothetical protein Pme01_20140 [Planosporangium mesophilum]
MTQGPEGSYPDMSRSLAGPCVCGHDRQAHEHYRSGSDCALCVSPRCDRFRPQRAGRLATLARRILRHR